MLSLSLNSLSVDLLNPADARDRGRMGTRYCWGGYIWQVYDQQAGPLLTGPEWPDPSPTPFNGQGLPESFRHTELGTDRALMLEDGRGFIIGIGEVAPNDAGESAVTKPCQWSVTRSARVARSRRSPRSSTPARARCRCIGSRTRSSLSPRAC